MLGRRAFEEKYGTETQLYPAILLNASSLIYAGQDTLITEKFKPFDFNISCTCNEVYDMLSLSPEKVAEKIIKEMGA